MKKYLSAKIIVPFALLAGSQLASANTIVTLGDQDFADGDTPPLFLFRLPEAVNPRRLMA